MVYIVIFVLFKHIFIHQKTQTMKLQHLTIAACILLATASCNSGSSTTTARYTAGNTMSEDTSMSMMQ